MRTIALFMGLNDSYEHGIARGVIRFARTRSDLRLHGYGWMFAGIRDIHHWNGDGIVARVESDRDAALLASLQMPIVDVAGAYTRSGFALVTNDDAATGEVAARHLSSRGFTRFAYCGVTDVGWSALRYRGFCDGAAAYRIGGSARQRDTVAIPRFDAPLTWWEQPERIDGLRNWLSGLARPVGLFACNDTAGLKVTALCRSLGVRVPGEVAVLGVDDEDIPCELSSPPLSSIPLNCEEIGFRAARRLVSMIDGTQRDAARSDVPRQVVPPFDPIERESTAVYVSDDPVVRRAGLFIRSHVGEAFGVADVAEAAAVSRRTLELHYRRETGKTVHAEIVATRLFFAAALLTGSREPVASIAERCGFATASRFYRAFGNQFGCTPSAFRRQHADVLRRQRPAARK